MMAIAIGRATRKDLAKLKRILEADSAQTGDER